MDCLSGVCGTYGESPYERESSRIKRNIEIFRSIPGIYLEIRLDENGKFDKRDLDRIFGRPIDEIREEEAIRKENEKLVDEWVGPTANDIILDCLNLLEEVRRNNRKKVRSHRHGKEEEKLSKIYKDAVDRMAMKFKCPSKYASKIYGKLKVDIINEWWWNITVPMKDMMAAAHIEFDGDKFIVEGKELKVSDFLGPGN